MTRQAAQDSSKAIDGPLLPEVETDVHFAARRLSVLLLQTRETMAAQFRPIFAAQDITDPQWRVLRILATSDEIDVADLARRSHVLGPSLSRILKLLTERDLIVRRVSKTDSRRSFLSLTAAGANMVREIIPKFDPLYADLEARLGKVHLENLNAHLEQLLAAFSDHGEVE